MCANQRHPVRQPWLSCVVALWAVACGNATEGDNALGHAGGATSVAPSSSTAGAGGIFQHPSAAGSVAVASSAAGNATAPCSDFLPPVAVGHAEPALLSTLSGLVASRSQVGVFLAHPDRSGPVIFALNQSGTLLRELRLSGATTTDCEDIAIGPGPQSPNTVYLGDIGDNAARSGSGEGRAEIQILRFAEPTIPAKATGAAAELITDWQSLRFSYPDRPHDAESLAIDPHTGEIVIITREANGSAFVFSAPGSTAAETPTVLTAIAQIAVGASGANAADISPTGDRALIRTYAAAWLYQRNPSDSLAMLFSSPPLSLPVANEAQSEGATFGADGRSWFSSGEADPTIYRAESPCP